LVLVLTETDYQSDVEPLRGGNRMDRKLKRETWILTHY